MNPERRFSRREALRHLSAGALLTLGLWPGALRAGDAGGGGAFRFIVVNDTHCMSPECEDYLAGVVRQMMTVNADFCLHAGDLTDKADRRSMEAVKRAFAGLSGPTYPVIGNHDYASPTDRATYEDLFPGRLNYFFDFNGWQFVALDTTEGQKYEKTRIQPETLRWVDETLPRLDKKKPLIVFTHFPLGAGTKLPAGKAPESIAQAMKDLSTTVATVKYRPLNADELLDRFRDFNLRAVYSGHYHAFTESRRGDTVLTTNRCCALKRDNHDGTKEKGYFVCEAKDGQVTRTFVEYKPPQTKAATEGKS